jgi:hypothetical protein
MVILATLPLSTMSVFKSKQQEVEDLKARVEDLKTQRDHAKEQRDQFRQQRDALRVASETASARLVDGEFVIEKPVYLVAKRARLAYVRIPKAACSTIRSILMFYNDPQLYAEKIGHFEGANYEFHQADNVVEETTDPPEDCLRFTVVRHPYDRFLSYFHNLMMDKRGGVLSPEMLEETNVRLGAFGFRIGMSFAEYCDAVFSRSHRLQNPHVRRQVDQLLAGGTLAVDFIGRMETLVRDMGRIAALCGQEPPPMKNLNRSSNTGWRNSALITGEVREKLASFYDQDLAFFGYKG